MIAVDTNVIAYLLIPGDRTPQARTALEKDPDWVAPPLWRSEFRNALALYLRQGQTTLSRTLQRMQEAEFLMQGREHAVISSQVLSLVAGSRCSAYDCEFVALAQTLNIALVTLDSRILTEFPATAISLDEFVS